MALVVVEIIGVSGSGEAPPSQRSWRAASLKRAGAPRHASASPPSLTTWPKPWRVSATLARQRGMSYELTDKLHKGLRASLRRCGKLARDGRPCSRIKEPGWLSQLVALATHEPGGAFRGAGRGRAPAHGAREELRLSSTFPRNRALNG